MAHELVIGKDGKASMFYVDEVPWHGLGTRLSEPPTAANAIRAANLDWEVAKAPLFYHASIRDTGVVPNLHALVPDMGWPHDERPLFGVVSGKYEILQNRDAFAFFDPVVAKKYAAYETAGALGKGERVWVMVKLREDFEVAPGDVIQRYLLLSNSHDGKASVQIKFTPVRVVCQNTLSMALADYREVFSIRHDPSLHKNLDAVADEMIGRIELRYGDLRQNFARMLRTSITDDLVCRYLAAVFPNPEAPTEKSQRPGYERRKEATERDRWTCTQILHESPHCRLAGDTLWAAYNAVTEFTDHWRPATSHGRSQSGNLHRIWFGTGYRQKVRAYEEALKLCLN